MSLFADWFHRKFLAAEHAAENIVHQAEKEFEMVSQAFADAIARIKALISGASDHSAADAKTISDLQAANAAKDAQIADLQSQLSDATSQLADIEQQLLALAPAA